MMMNLVGHATKQKTQKKTICNTTNILPRDFRRFYNKKQMNLVQFLNNATEWDAIVSFDDDNKYIEKTTNFCDFFLSRQIAANQTNIHILALNKLNSYRKSILFMQNEFSFTKRNVTDRRTES